MPDRRRQSSVPGVAAPAVLGQPPLTLVSRNKRISSHRQGLPYRNSCNTFRFPPSRGHPGLLALTINTHISSVKFIGAGRNTLKAVTGLFADLGYARELIISSFISLYPGRKIWCFRVKNRQSTVIFRGNLQVLFALHLV